MGNVLSPQRDRQGQTAVRPTIRSLHHFSFRCFDAEETRRYYEDFLGLELYAALPFTVDLAGKPAEALRILFRMSNGDFFSFSDVPDDIRPDIYESIGPHEVHFAMKVSSESDWEVWIERLTKAGIKYIGPLDHEFLRSVYFQDPNGLWLEITYQVADHDKILDREKAQSRAAMEAWTLKTSERKAKFSRTVKAA